MKKRIVCDRDSDFNKRRCCTMVINFLQNQVCPFLIHRLQFGLCFSLLVDAYLLWVIGYSSMSRICHFTRLVPALQRTFRNVVCFSHIPRLKAQYIYSLTTLTTLQSHCSFHKNSKCCASLIGTSLPALCPIHHLCLQMVSPEGQISHKSLEKSQTRHTRIKEKRTRDTAKGKDKKRLSKQVS